MNSTSTIEENFHCRIEKKSCIMLQLTFFNNELSSCIYMLYLYTIVYSHDKQQLLLLDARDENEEEQKQKTKTKKCEDFYEEKFNS